MTPEFMANIRLQCLQMATGGGSLMARDDAEQLADKWANWVLWGTFATLPAPAAGSSVK